MGGNVVKVNHERSDDSNRVTDCILQLQVETRNHEHVEAIRNALLEAGFSTQCQVY
jgi:threonine dehydratase